MKIPDSRKYTVKGFTSAAFQKPNKNALVHRVVDAVGDAQLVAVNDQMGTLVQYVLRKMVGMDVVQTRPLGKVPYQKARDELRSPALFA